MITLNQLLNECQSIADDLLKEAIYKRDNGECFDLMDEVHCAVDSHQWVIYNGQAQAVCTAATFRMISDAEDALIDIGFMTQGDFSFWKTQVAMAYEIMRQQVMETIDYDQLEAVLSCEEATA